LSSWEDPSFLPQKVWSPFSSNENLQFWLSKIVSNCGDLCQMLNDFSILALPAIGLALYLVIRQMRRERRAYHPMAALLLAIFVLAGGYLVVFLEQRYIWLGALGILRAGRVAIQHCLGPDRSGHPLVLLLALGFSLSFAVTPIQWIWRHRGIDREYRDAAGSLPDMTGSHFASNDMTGLYFAYYKRAKFYGLPQGVPDRIEAQLNRYQIDRYFLIGARETPPGFVREADRLDSGQFPNFRVYRIEPSKRGD
jgi:hypothetical protein